MRKDHYLLAGNIAERSAFGEEGEVARGMLGLLGSVNSSRLIEDMGPESVRVWRTGSAEVSS